MNGEKCYCWYSIRNSVQYHSGFGLINELPIIYLIKSNSNELEHTVMSIITCFYFSIHRLFWSIFVVSLNIWQIHRSYLLNQVLLSDRTLVVLMIVPFDYPTWVGLITVVSVTLKWKISFFRENRLTNETITGMNALNRLAEVTR